MAFYPDRDSDHLHSIGRGADGSFERTADFCYDEIDRNLGWAEDMPDTVTFSDMSAAFSMILGYLCQDNHCPNRPANLAHVGARAESLLFLLDSNQSRYKSLADIGRAAGLTRAAISKALIELKDQVGLMLSAGKGHFTRATYRQAQIEALEAGRHSSQVRKQKELA
jgi:biotin operon repressor